jgi:hypothetical protein
MQTSIMHNKSTPTLCSVVGSTVTGYIFDYIENHVLVINHQMLGRTEVISSIFNRSSLAEAYLAANNH